MAEKEKSSDKPAKRKRRSPEEIMERLLQAAEDVFGEMGYASATTKEIARRADITEAQLFRYFDSKAELFREAIFKPLNQNLAEFNQQYHNSTLQPGNHREQSRRYISELQNFIRKHWKMMMALVVTQAYSPEGVRGLSEIDSLHDYFEHNAEIMSSRISTPPVVDPELMVRVSFAAVLANVMFKEWIFPDGLASDDAITASIINFVLDGINANYDPELSRKE